MFYEQTLIIIYLLAFQYKEYLSDFKTWNQREHCSKWLLFVENIGSKLSIDEASISNGNFTQ